MPRVLEKYNMKDLGSARAIKILMQENASLKNALPTAHISTTSTQLTDSAEDLPIENVKLKGQTSQEQYEGRNSIPTQEIDWEQGGISSLNGSDSPSTTRLRTKDFYPIANDTNYFLSVQDLNYVYNNLFFYDSNKSYLGSYYDIDSTISGARNKVINIPTSSIPNVAFFRAVMRSVISTSTTIEVSEITAIKPQIESGSTAHDWEPYVDGQPAPNPNYKSDIHRATGECNEKFVNKNLFDKSLFSVFSTELQYITLTLQPNTTYTMSSNLPAWTGVGSNLFFMKDGDSPSTATNGVKPDTAITLTTDSTGIVKIGYRDGGNTLTHETTNYLYQIEVGSTASDYVPHAEQNAPLSLGNIELCQIGDYQDYIYKENGNWYKYGAIGKVVLDGSVNGSFIFKHNSITSETKGFYVFVLPNKNKTFNSGYTLGGISNYFRFQSGTAVNVFDNYNSALWWEGTTNNAYAVLEETSLADANNWLLTHNTTVYYVLETPTTTQITDTTLVNQLNNLLKLKTYKDITNIESSGTALAPVLDCDYYKSISSLEDRIEILEAQVALLEE